MSLDNLSLAGLATIVGVVAILYVICRVSGCGRNCR